MKQTQRSYNSTLRPGGRLKRSRMKRRPRSAAKTRRIYGPSSRRAWVRSLPCIYCGIEGYSVNAHVCGNEGISRKGHYSTIVPLCAVRFMGRSMVKGCHEKFDAADPPFDAPEVREEVTSRASIIEAAWKEICQTYNVHDGVAEQ